MRTSALLSVLIATCLRVNGLAAQSALLSSHGSRGAAGPSRTEFMPGASAGDSARERTSERARVMLPTVTVSGKPGSLEVVAVPVPSELTASRAHFRILATPGVRVLGRIEGDLAPRPRQSNVIVTLSAPRSALAGRASVASAEFDAGSGSAIYEVPIEMSVIAVHRVELALIDQVLGARRGDYVNIRFRAVNLGNVADSISVGVQLPEGWKLAGGLQHSIQLAPHAAQNGALRIWIPPQGPSGSQFVHVVASSAGAVVSAGDVRVELASDADLARGEGPRLTLGTAASSISGGPASVAYLGSIDGDLSDSVRMSASGVWRPSNSQQTAAADLALLRLGVPVVPASFAIASPSLRFGAGLTGGGLSDLSGNYVNGLGVSGGARFGAWSVSGVDARPYQFGVSTASHEALGGISDVRVDRRVDSGSVFVIASHLVDGTQARALDAATVGAAFGATPIGQLSSELGYRRYDDGAGMGWAGEVNRQGDAGSFDVRLLHAPGGAKAFARATDELTSTGTRRLDDWISLGGGFWKTGDASSTIGASSGLGWSVGPTFSFRSLGASGSIQARHSSLDVMGQTGGFGDRETGISTSANVQRASIFANGLLTVGTVTRTVELTSGEVAPTTGDNIDARASVGTFVGTGSVQLDAGAQRLTGEAGLTPYQTSIALRAEHLAVPIGARWNVYVGGEVQRLVFAYGSAPALSQRYTLSVPLPGGVAVTALAERNPFYTLGSNGRVGWLTAIRVDQSRFLPRLVSPGQTHVVYHDSNNNGRRDRGEEGVAGVVITCSGRTVITDARGRFKCGANEQFELDPRSLPASWVAPPMSRDGIAQSDVGLIPMKAVRIQIALLDVDTLRVSREDLAKLVIVARDTANQPWMTSAIHGELVFDALPPGRYSVDVDASAIDEPLTVVNPVSFVVGGDTRADVRILLRGRATRTRILPPTQSDGGNAPKAERRSIDRNSSVEEKR